VEDDPDPPRPVRLVAQPVELAGRAQEAVGQHAAAPLLVALVALQRLRQVQRRRREQARVVDQGGVERHRDQVQAYSGSSQASAPCPRSSGRKVSTITAISLVVVTPPATASITASTAPGCGPCVKPAGCSEIEPTSMPDPRRAE